MRHCHFRSALRFRGNKNPNNDITPAQSCYVMTGSSIAMLHYSWSLQGSCLRDTIARRQNYFTDWVIGSENNNQCHTPKEISIFSWAKNVVFPLFIYFSNTFRHLICTVPFLFYDWLLFRKLSSHPWGLYVYCLKLELANLP